MDQLKGFWYLWYVSFLLYPSYQTNLLQASTYRVSRNAPSRTISWDSCLEIQFLCTALREVRLMRMWWSLISRRPGRRVTRRLAGVTRSMLSSSSLSAIKPFSEDRFYGKTYFQWSNSIWVMERDTKVLEEVSCSGILRVLTSQIFYNFTSFVVGVRKADWFQCAL